MTRQQYIQLLNNNSRLQIAYLFYQEECIKKNVEYLQPQEFVNFFLIWEHHQYYIHKTIEYYNKLFDVRQLLYNNQIIKFL